MVEINEIPGATSVALLDGTLVNRKQRTGVSVKYIIENMFDIV